MNKGINNINIFIYAFIRANKDAFNFLLENIEENFYISDFDHEINQSYYSVKNRYYALKNPNPIENYFYLTANFYQQLEKDKQYTCTSHAFTLMLLKEMNKKNLISELMYKKIMSLDINDLRLGLGVEIRKKETKMYSISFKKKKNITLSDLMWIKKFTQILNLPHSIKYTIHDGSILFILPVERNISLAKIKVLGNLLKDLLILANTTVQDITYSTQHYYNILKKCQIMTK